MGTLAHSSWLGQVLRCLPGSWLTMLDAWSYRVAVQRREKRRLAGSDSRAAAPSAYKLKPWRD
jgi:hypothetical protein